MSSEKATEGLGFWQDLFRLWFDNPDRFRRIYRLMGRLMEMESD